MKDLFINFVLLFFATQIFAQCSVSSLYFTLQEQIDLFGQNHPECTDFTIVKILGDDIDNLEGLSHFEKIDWLVIGETKLTNLHGLHNLTNLGRIRVERNENLNSLLDLNVTERPGFIVIKDNRNLKNCNIICDWFQDDPATFIKNNGIGCTHKFDLECENYVQGSVYYDKNRNKVQDVGEYGIPYIFVQENDQGFWKLSNSQGRFGFKGANGDVVKVFPQLDTSKWMLTTDSSSYSFVYGSPGAQDKLFFGVVPKKKEHKLDVFFLRKPGGHLSVLVKNKGAFFESGRLVVRIDSLNYIKSTFPALDEQNDLAGVGSWVFDDIPPFSVQRFDIDFSVFAILLDSQDVEVYLEGVGDEVDIPEAKKVKMLLKENWDGCNVFLNAVDKKNLSLPSDREQAYQYNSRGINKDILVLKIDNNFDLESYEFVYGDVPFEIRIDGSTIFYSVLPFFEHSYSFLYTIKPKDDILSPTILKTIFSSNGNLNCNEEIYCTAVSPLRSWEIEDEGLLLGPNPTSDFFRMQYNVDYVNEGSKLLIYNGLGQVVKVFSVISGQRYFVDDLIPGFYTVLLYTPSAKRALHAGKLFVN